MSLIIFSVSSLLCALCLWYILKTRAGLSREVKAPQTQVSLIAAPPEYTKFVFGVPQYPALEITRLDATAAREGQAISLTQAQLSRLNGLFAYLPNLASGLATAAANTYVLRFAPEAVRGLADGSLKISQAATGGLRAFAVDAQGRIAAHGALLPAGISPVMASIAAWQVLALLTGQHYLTQIAQQLRQVEQGVSDLKAHLEAHDVAALTSSLKQLTAIKAMLDGCEFQEAEILSCLVSLDAIDRECGRIMEVYRSHQERYTTEFNASSLKGWFNADFASAEAKLQQCEQAARICLQAIFVKGLAAQFRCALPSDRRLAQHRLTELQQELSLWQTTQETFHHRFIERIQDDTKPTIPLRSQAEAREKILGEAAQSQQEVYALHDELKQTLTESVAHLAGQMQTFSQPLMLAVTLDEQKRVEQVSRLPPKA